MAYVNYALNIFTTVMLGIVLAGSLRVYRMEPGQSLHFLAFILLSGIGTLSQSIFWWETARNRNGSVLSIIADEIYYVCFYSILVCFVYFVVEYISRKKPVSLWFGRITVPIGVVCALIWTVPGLRAYMYQADAQEGMLPGSIYMAGSVGGYLIGMVALCVILRNLRLLDRYEKTALFSFMVFPAIANLVSILVEGISCMPFFIALSVLLIQNFLQYNNMLVIREQRQRIREDKVRMMLSQIQPHFIYNVLNTIYYLCGTDSRQARQAIETFSAYLRRNLSSIEREETIPLEEELEHVRLYLQLEQMRFMERLKVDWDLQRLDGCHVPPLSVEPIVENAVKHGISAREKGGRLTIRTREEEESFLILVEDDGAGFNPEQALIRTVGHIGLTNVKERIETVCDGTLVIDSAPGQGTTVSITLPKKRRKRRR